MSKAKKRDPILKRKWKITFVGIIFLIAVFSPQGIRLYDEWADDMANPGYLGQQSPMYVGGWYEFSVDKEYQNMVVVNFNTSIHNFNKTYYPDTSDWPVGFSCPHYWLVNERHGPDVFERVDISMYWFVARFDIIERTEPDYLVYEFSCWELVEYDSWLSEPEYHDPVSDLTLFFDWHGWI